MWSIGVIAYVIMVGKTHIESEKDDRKVELAIKNWNPNTDENKAFHDQEFKKIDPDA